MELIWKMAMLSVLAISPSLASWVNYVSPESLCSKPGSRPVRLEAFHLEGREFHCEGIAPRRINCLSLAVCTCPCDIIPPTNCLPCTDAATPPEGCGVHCDCKYQGQACSVAPPIKLCGHRLFEDGNDDQNCRYGG